VIEQTVEAAFRQVCGDVFRYSEDETVPEGVDVEALKDPDLALPEGLSIYTRHAYLLFSDLCNLINGDPLEWIKMESVNISLCLSILQESIDSQFFTHSPEMRKLLSTKLCPAVHRAVRSSDNMNTVKNLFKLIVSVLEQHFSALLADSEILLNLILKAVEDTSNQDGPDFGKNYLALESLRSIMLYKNGELARNIALSLDLQRGTDTHVLKSAISTSLIVLKSIKIDPSRVPANPMSPSFPSFGVLPVDLGSPGSLVSTSLGICFATLEALKAGVNGDEGGQMKAMLFDLFECCWEDVVLTLSPFLTIHLFSPRDIDYVLESFASLFEIANMSDSRAREELLRILSRAATRKLDALKASKGSNSYDFLARRSASLYHCLIKCTDLSLGKLGKSWRFVFAALEPLDHVLYVKDSSYEPAMYEHLAKLLGDFESIFRSMKVATADQKIEICTALIAQSRTQVANKSSITPVHGSCRIFGVVRVDELLQQWLDIDKRLPNGLWELVSGHLVSLVNDCPEVHVRTLALKTLGKLIEEYLSVESPETSQEKVISPLSDLLNNNYTNTYYDFFCTVYNIIHNRGERIFEDIAWIRLLDILKMTLATEKPKFVEIGFKTVQLISRDFLFAFSCGAMLGWIQLVGAFASQRKDLNNALTAVGMLWTTGDYLVKMESADGEKPESYSEEVRDLWMNLFLEMRKLGLDERPEVRNGAIRTLSGCLSAHGARFQRMDWMTCIECSIMPLLSAVILEDHSATEKRPSEDAKPPSKEDILVHHSRDTPEKQWDETKVLTLSGLSRIFKAHLSHMFELDKFEVTWSLAIDCSKHMLVSSARELYSCGVQSLLDLLFGVAAVAPTSPESQEKKDRLWSLMMDCIINLTEMDGNDESSRPQSKALGSLVEGLAACRSSCPASFSNGDSLKIVEIFVNIAKTGYKVYLTRRSESLHLVALSALESIDFGDDEVTWKALIASLLGLAAVEDSAERDSSLQEKSISVLKSIYVKQPLPPNVKMMVLPDTLKNLQPVMMNRPAKISLTSFEKEPLWGSAVVVFDAAVRDACGLGAELHLDAPIFAVFHDIARSFLYQNKIMVSGSPMFPAPGCKKPECDAERFDVLLIKLTHLMLVNCKGCPNETMKALIEVLTQGAESPSCRCELARWSQEALFALADDAFLAETPSDDKEAVSQLAYDAVLSLSESLMKKFIEDCLLTGRRPLPIVRRAEMAFVMKKLMDLRATRTASQVPYAHLKTLYPVVLEESRVKDRVVAGLASDLMALLAKLGRDAVNIRPNSDAASGP